jgi:hypothetical protein
MEAFLELVQIVSAQDDNHDINLNGPKGSV